MLIPCQSQADRGVCKEIKTKHRRNIPAGQWQFELQNAAADTAIEGAPSSDRHLINSETDFCMQAEMGCTKKFQISN